ncbi:EAL domain-containing protein [Priestia abyssalis]|uniref:EAL domain-containing protein n=1 Tax=Priestia abyssalis TaxID=1221450 RepID=UPI000994D7A0|nr:EAL domain-containing protein [Priestia abyssalis]
MIDNQVLADTYHSPLFILSFLITFVTCYTSLELTFKMMGAESNWKQAWLMSSAVVLGGGLWAMESVSFLAFPVFTDGYYHYGYAVLALFIGVGSSYVSFLLVKREGKRTLAFLAANLVLVSGFFFMRHVSLLGVGKIGISYDRTWLAASIGIALLTSFAATWLLFFRMCFRRLYVISKAILALMVTFALGAIHYTAMLALRLDLTAKGKELHSFRLPIQTEWVTGFILLFLIFLFLLMFVVTTLERKIRRQQKAKRAIFYSSLDPIVVTNEQSEIIVMNPVADALFNMDVTGQPIFSFLSEFDGVDQLLGKRLETKLSVNQREDKIIELTVTSVDLDGEREYIFSMRDVTEQKQVEAELSETSHRYERLFYDAPLAMVVHRNGRIISANEETVKLVRVDKREGIIGKSLFDFIAMEEHDAVQKLVQELSGSPQTQDSVYNQFRIFNAKKEEMYVQTKSSIIKMKGISYIQTILHDVTEQRKVKQTVQYMAYQDLVTGLPTAGIFNTLANNALERVKKHGGSAALLLIDLDRFKYVTDTHGRHVGDYLLKEVARRIQQVILSTDLISRYGLDSFLVLLQNRDRQQVIHIIGELLNRVGAAFRYEDFEVYVSASIGATIFPDDGMALDPLIHQADIAMYYTKKHHRNSFTFYDTVMHEESTKRMLLEEGLRRAVLNEEFELYYQPKIDSKNGFIAGVEALIRWNHPTLGRVSPGEFIPVAEETGFILAISEWALKTACRQNKQWQEQGMRPMRVAVNISSVDFGEQSFIPMVMDALKETKLDPQYLELEITETVAIKNMEVVIEKLHMLKQMGIYISIDDFGAGYSSLSYIQKLPIHALKIDKSFLQALMDNEKEETIVKAIIMLAKSLDLEVVAEGVEEEQQARLLIKEQCDEMQGYYFSRPLSVEEFAAKADQIERKSCALTTVTAL